MKVGAIAMLALLGIGAAPAPGDSVGLKASSWGRLLREWRVDANGDGELRQGDAGGRPPLDGYEVTIRKVHVGPTGYALLRQKLFLLHVAALEKYTCKVTITDMVYGRVYFTSKGQIDVYSFNDGCTTQRDRELQAAMRAADTIVQNAAKAAPVVARATIGPDKPALPPLNEEQ